MKSLFNPKNSNPFKVVIQMENPMYSEGKAIDLINQASSIVKFGKRSEDYNNLLEQAVSLLVLARCQREILQTEGK